MILLLYLIMKKHVNPIVKIKDGKYVRIYYRNTMFSTPYSLSQAIKKDISNPYFSWSNRQFKKGFGKNYKEANKVILDKQNLITSLIRKAESQGLDTLTYIKAHFKEANEVLSNRVITNTSMLIDVFTDYVLEKDRKKNNLDDENKPMKKYIPHAFIENLKDFDSKNKRDTKIEDVDEDWVMSFCKYLVKPKERYYTIFRKTDLAEYNQTRIIRSSNPSVVKHLLELNAMFRLLMNKFDFIQYPIDEVTKFIYTLPTRTTKKHEKEEWAYDILTQQEFEILRNYDIPEKVLKKTDKGNVEWEIPKQTQNEWRIILDMFLFCAYTGLRYSDVKTVNIGMINANKTQMSLDSIKTGRKVMRTVATIPINKNAVELLEKYNYTFKDIAPTNQNANIKLRKVLSLIPEFDRKVEKKEYYISDIESDFYPKNQVLSWHSSRRFFATKLIRLGFDINQLQSATGWVDIRSLQAYMSQVRAEDGDDSHLLIQNF